jgi:3-vinyl bacteriochlorophyllide hydratase
MGLDVREKSLGGIVHEEADRAFVPGAAALQPHSPGVPSFGAPEAVFSAVKPAAATRTGLYTAEERARRDASKWTLVQGLLAPFQFIVCLASIVLIARFLLTGEGLWAANASVVAKTVTLYTIMVTGAIWEKDVFGRYLFAPAFFWEDAVSMVVIALHTIYLAALFTSWLTPVEMMALALTAYAAYIVNAAQFLRKLRLARLDAAELLAGNAGTGAAR